MILSNKTITITIINIVMPYLDSYLTYFIQTYFRTRFVQSATVASDTEKSLLLLFWEMTCGGDYVKVVLSQKL